MRFERMILTMGTVTALGLGSAASAAMDPLDAITICSRISNKSSRLECYDGIARDAASGRLSRGPVTAPPPNWSTPPAPSAPNLAPQQAGPAPTAGFGAEELPNQRADIGPDSIDAEVVSSTDNGLGMWRMRMADGSIWEMTERMSLFRPPAPHETVKIRKGALGGFLMDVGKQTAVRVRRVK